MKTKRCLLRHLTMDDAMEVYGLAKDPEVGPNAGWEPHKSMEETQEILKTILINEFNYGIFLKDTNEFIGCIGLNPSKKRNNINAMMMGYWIGKKHWGKGYATEAGVEMIRYAFDDVGLNILEIDHDSTNKKSENVIKKLGFIYEGCLRQAKVRKSGEIIDDIMYSMTKEEYKKK